MILQRLYELAVREQLLDDPAFEKKDVKWTIGIGPDGRFLGLSELIGDATATPSGKAPPNRGRPLDIPLSLGSANAPGAARFFADATARVIPITSDLDDPDGPGSEAERAKRARSRATFWAQINLAADATDDPALRDAQDFGRRLGDPEFVAEINAETASKGAMGADRCTFAWHDDLGGTILEREPIKAFFREQYQAWTGGKQEDGPKGVCQITGEIGPLPTTHPLKIQGVPGGLPTGVSLVSFDKDAFQSYGLDGAANAGVGYRAADGYCRAISALIKEDLAGNPPTRLRVGESLFLIWPRDRDPVAGEIVRSLSDPTQAREARQAIRQAAGMVRSVEEQARDRKGPRDPNRLYCLALSGNAARAIVRDYLEVPLAEAAENVGRWFDQLTIVGVETKGAVASSGEFPIWLLALATARKSEDVGPAVYAQLLSAALRGSAAPLPDSILVACLNRARAEASQAAFKSHRMALIKLFLLRRCQLVTPALDESNTNPAYVCGRLLAVFEEIQYKALGDVNANVGDKYYGNFSATPSMVFARLLDNARKHLRKIRSESQGASTSMTAQLAGIMVLIDAPPPGVLPPIEQAKFALGYYHQLHARFQAIQDAKAAKANAAEAEVASQP